MNQGSNKKTVKEIKVDLDKCAGCRACEMACALSHAENKFGVANPAMSRIHVLIKEMEDVYVPIRAGCYTPSECNGRHTVIIDGKEYGECSFCRASCPSRDYFKEPGSGLPLKCDMCENEDIEEPYCVQACTFDALTYEEREEEAEPVEEEIEDVDVVMESLINKYGKTKVVDSVSRFLE